MADAPKSWVDHYGLVHPLKKALLLSYASGCTIAGAAEKVGVGRQTHYNWMNLEHDEREAYQQAFDEAKERRFDILELEARRRAVDGVEEVYLNDEGNVSHTVRKYSDTLLIFLMKAAHPETYRDNIRHEVSGVITLENLLTMTG